MLFLSLFRKKKQSNFSPSSFILKMATVPVDVRLQGHQHPLQGYFVLHNGDYKIAIPSFRPRRRRDQTALCFYDRAALAWTVANPQDEGKTATLTAHAVTPAQLEKANPSFLGTLEFASTNISFPSASPRCPTGPTFNFRSLIDRKREASRGSTKEEIADRPQAGSEQKIRRKRRSLVDRKREASRGSTKEEIRSREERRPKEEIADRPQAGSEQKHIYYEK